MKDSGLQLPHVAQPRDPRLLPLGEQQLRQAAGVGDAIAGIAVVERGGNLVEIIESSTRHREILVSSTRETLVPGMDIVRGTLLVDETMMCKPSDLLHEAAHIALTHPSVRNALDGTADTSPAEEVSAIAWTWAASR